MLNLSATGRPERTGNPSYTAQLLLVVGSGFPTGVGRPALGRPEGAGFPRYRTQLLLVQASGFPKLVGYPGLGRPEEAGCPGLGRSEEAGCPRHWSCFLITAEQWRCGMSRTMEM